MDPYPDMPPSLRHINLPYDHLESRAAALRLVLALRPEWEDTQDQIEFVRFTDGITNTLLKAEYRKPGWTKHQIDEEAVLLRAYGKGTDLLIDRERESRSHSLLASLQLAPPLLARFDNGLMYKFIEGQACSPADLRRPEVWRAVARRLGQWHATLPISSISSKPGINGHAKRNRRWSTEAVERITPGKPVPNLWTVLQKWITGLPSKTEAQQARKAQLQSELEWLVVDLGDTAGIDDTPFIFGHCDLLSGNVIIQPQSCQESVESSESTQSSDSEDSPCITVSFIDYEYTTPAPAAFDIANHFAEWGGLECDFSVLPSRSQRRDFLREYLHSYNARRGRVFSEGELTQLFDETDKFRGVPGFYWGIWGLIQATISQIDFDYASYAEVRLSEYWAWKREMDGSREASREPMPLREQRWSQE